MVSRVVLGKKSVNNNAIWWQKSKLYFHLIIRISVHSCKLKGLGCPLASKFKYNEATHLWFHFIWYTHEQKWSKYFTLIFAVKTNCCSSDMLRSLSLLTSPFLPFLPPEMKRAPLGQSAREEGAISHFPISRAAEKIIPCCESSMRRPDIIMNSPTLPPTPI